MKPRVFLSHSKKDEEFIVKIANDLRLAQIDSWYDDWEIPPGTSIRRKIFEEGIPNCDVFFVYLSENSIDSYWVTKELDAAIIQQAESRNENIILFCSSEEVRSKLSLDLRSCNIPVLTENEYDKSMLKFIAAIYQNFINKMNKNFELKKQNELLLLKNQLLEMQNTYFQRGNGIDFENLKNKLLQISITYNSKTVDLLSVFERTKNSFAVGTNSYKLDNEIMKLFDLDIVEPYLKIEPVIPRQIFDSIVGPLVIYQVLDIIPESDNTNKSYQLTEIGKSLLRSLA
ncbi:MAG: toll/interleukin-1 receptor domain-containing protein [Treponema sp.]|nr:toll/interleukin-1 receptor domain-containing protein [Treponema sp.]